MSITSSKVKSVAIIIGSTRECRIGPQIADFVYNTIKARCSSSDEPAISLIDLADWSLPIYNEPGIPSRIHDHNSYKYDHTKAWSQEIQKYDAFLFVSPQYNWGYPAVLKNAIDYLYNEWKDKAAMVVTYGGHGGNKCNAQLREVLTGLGMIVTQHVELTFPSKDLLVKAATGNDLGLDARSNSSPWSAEKGRILKAYDSLVGQKS